MCNFNVFQKYIKKNFYNCFFYSVKLLFLLFKQNKKLNSSLKWYIMKFIIKIKLCLGILIDWQQFSAPKWFPTSFNWMKPLTLPGCDRLDIKLKQKMTLTTPTHLFDSVPLSHTLIPSLFLSIPTQSNAEHTHCSDSGGHDDPCVLLSKQQLSSLEKWVWILYACPPLLPQPPTVHFIAWTRSDAATHTGCNGNWNIMEHFCRLIWTLCPYHLLNRSQNRPTLHGLLRVDIHTHTH